MSAPTKRNSLKRGSRRYTPSIPQLTKNYSLIQKFIYRTAAKYDVTKDKEIQRARLTGGKITRYFTKGGKVTSKIIEPRCANMHPYRAETMHAVMLCMILLSDFSLDTKSHFEVAFSLETIAAKVGQRHVYANGRIAVDCVLHAIADLELAGYVFALREPCKETNKNKTNRYFLTPAFFNAFGISNEELVQKMEELRSYRERKKILNKTIAAAEATESRRNRDPRLSDFWYNGQKKVINATREIIEKTRAVLAERREAKKLAQAAKQADKARAIQDNKAAATLAEQEARTSLAVPYSKAQHHLSSIMGMFDDPLPS